jgi:hypothetical protein
MAAQLTDPSIQGDLRILLISEVGGVEAFTAAEHGAATIADRKTWMALRALEIKTRSAVYANLGEIADRFATSEQAAVTLGRASGACLALMPRRMQLYTLTTATKAFLPRFEKLHRHFHDTEFEPFFAFVVAHEKAIADVGRRGLRGDQEPLVAVETLLDA